MTQMDDRRASACRTFAAALLVAIAGCAGPAGPATSPPDAVREAPDPVLDALLDRRAHEVAGAISQDPRWPTDLFDEAFRRNVSDTSIRQLFAGTWTAEGAAHAVRLVRHDSARAARYEIELDRGGAMQMDVRLAEVPPHAVRYLWMYRSVPGHVDLTAVERAMAGLRGSVSFAVDRLDDGGPRRVVDANPELALDVASAFKLYVLGALVDDIRAGRRAWTDIVPLRAQLRSIPTGLIHRWPDGAPVTLHTLASLMIEQSDNTATDHLLFLLGREKVESMLEPMGNAHAGRNLPLLSTGEMFRLKYADGGSHAATYLSLGPDARRAYLASAVDGIEMANIDTPSGRQPRFIDTIGWFASAGDLCRAMDWLRRATESGPAAPARAILGIEPGTTEPRDVFPYQGYKGGRLPGIASGTYLVQSGGGAWFVVSATWNDASQDVDEPTLRGHLTRALQLLARER